MRKIKEMLGIACLIFLLLVLGFGFAIMPPNKDKPKENKMECTCKPIAE